MGEKGTAHICTREFVTVLTKIVLVVWIIISSCFFFFFFFFETVSIFR